MTNKDKRLSPGLRGLTAGTFSGLTAGAIFAALFLFKVEAEHKEDVEQMANDHKSNIEQMANDLEECKEDRAWCREDREALRDIRKEYKEGWSSCLDELFERDNKKKKGKP